MAAIKLLKRKAGGKATAGAVQIPLDVEALVRAVAQLQDTVNEVITRFNAHTHVENTAGAYAQNASTAAPAAGQQVQGIDVADNNLFTP